MIRVSTKRWPGDCSRFGQLWTVQRLARQKKSCGLDFGKPEYVASIFQRAADFRVLVPEKRNVRMPCRYHQSANEGYVEGPDKSPPKPFLL